MSERSQEETEYVARQEVRYLPKPLGDGFVYSYPNYDTYRPAFFSRTKEERIMERGPGIRKSWNDVEHYKCTRSPTPPGTVLPLGIRAYEYEPHIYVGAIGNSKSLAHGYSAVGNLVQPFGEPGMPVQGLPAFSVPRSDGGFIPAPVNLDQLKGLSARTMLPGIKAELSALNSLIELKDFKSLPDTLRNMYTFVRQNLLPRSSRTLRQLLQTGSDGYLQSQFNILPLLQDISGLQSAILRTKERIDDLLRRAQLPQRRHFTYAWQEYDNGTDASEAYFVYGSWFPAAFIQYTGAYLERSVYHDASVFHAEIEYRFTLSQYEVVNAQLLGFLDAMGVNANPSIIWNAIPWSFVVDWVVGIGRWLDNHKTLNLDPSVYIRRYLWSIKRGRTLAMRVKTLSLSPAWQGESETSSLPAVRETAYRRAVDSLDPSSLSASGLSLKELSLGASLTVPRKWRPRARH